MNIHMLNGRKDQDVEGEYTYVSSTGKSVVDYVLVPTDIFELVKTFCVSKIDLSDHFPLEFSLFEKCVTKQVVEKDTHDVESQSKENVRYRWNENKKDEFVSRLNDVVSAEYKVSFNEKCGDSIDEAVEILETMYNYAASSMKSKKRRIVDNVTQPKDEICLFEIF